MTRAAVTRERRTEGVARTPQEAADRLRAAGFRVIEPKRKGMFRPIDVPGLNLSRALEEARGKTMIESPAGRAFSVRRVLALTGLSRWQLWYWEKLGFVRPSLSVRRGHGNPRLYSFRDLVELRVAAALRQERVSLQKIRRAIDNLRRLQAEIERLDQRRPGMIERRRGTMGSQPVLADTRIPIASIRRLAEDGLSDREILGEYPDLTVADVREALAAGPWPEGLNRQQM